MSNKGLYNKKRLDASKYVNTDTGETLSSEFGNMVSSINVAHVDLNRMSSDSFVIIDNDAAYYLRSILSKSDLNYVRWMVEMVYGNYNILFDFSKKAPHTRASLMAEFDLARTAFSGLLNRLYKKGIIFYIDGYLDRKKFKHIMLNPTIGRKTNQIHKECLRYFQDLSDKNKRLSK